MVFVLGSGGDLPWTWPSRGSWSRVEDEVGTHPSGCASTPQSLWAGSGLGPGLGNKSEPCRRSVAEEQALVLAIGLVSNLTSDTLSAVGQIILLLRASVSSYVK